MRQPLHRIYCKINGNVTDVFLGSTSPAGLETYTLIANARTTNAALRRAQGKIQKLLQELNKRLKTTEEQLDLFKST